MTKRRRSGKKFPPRLCKQIIEYLGPHGEATTREIYSHLCDRTKMTPTRNQLSNILTKSGFFQKEGTIRMLNVVGTRSVVTIWSVIHEKSVAEGFLTETEIEKNYIEQGQ